jgi:hypothetical protein
VHLLTNLVLAAPFNFFSTAFASQLLSPAKAMLALPRLRTITPQAHYAFTSHSLQYKSGLIVEEIQTPHHLIRMDAIKLTFLFINSCLKRFPIY